MKSTKHIFVSLLILWNLSSCEEKITNPGDFSLHSELSVISVSDTLGNQYPLEIARTIDTTYMYDRIVKDTLKDANGNPILDALNKPQVQNNTVKYAGTKTAKYIELNPILLVSTKNQIKIEIASNSRWQAPTPNFGSKIPWYVTKTNIGGGSSFILADIKYAGLATARRPVLAVQYIYTRDSLTMYKLVFNQKALNEN